MNENTTPNDYHCTALLIGNKFGFLKRIAFALQHRGHTVVWADSGEMGLHLAELEQPGLIVSEIRLPDITGIEVCERVKSSFYFETPVVLVGRFRDEKIDSQLAYKAGAEDYFVSFTDRQLVLAKLEWLVQRGRPDYLVAERPDQFQLTNHSADARAMTYTSLDDRSN